MKILYVITKSNWGGAQRHVFDLATMMRDRGHEVKVAVGGEGILKTRLEAAGIFTYTISDLGRDISIQKDTSSLRKIFSIIKQQKPDVLHLHSPKAAGLGSLSGRILGVRHIVTTIHGWTWNENRPWHHRLAIIFFLWLTSIFCHKVIVLTRHDYDQGAKLPGLRKRMSVIPLGIKPATLYSVAGAKQTVAKTLNMSVPEYSKRFSIVNIAELHPNKGLDYLIYAIAEVAVQYPEVLCVVISDGQEKDRLQALINARSLEKNFILMGRVDNAAEYLKAFNLFVLSSVKEGLPYVLLEAGAASMPVVSTSVGGVPEIIHDMESGILIEPKNSRELAHAISFAIEHPEKRRSYASALYKKVTTDFTLEKMITDVEKAYKGEQ